MPDAVLNWIKVEADGKHRLVVGVATSPVSVYARATGGPDPGYFTVWERSFFVSAARFLHLDPRSFQVPTHGQRGKRWVSEEFMLGARKFGGQTTYYFEDNARPAHRSQGLGPTTAKAGTISEEPRGVQLEGGVERGKFSFVARLLGGRTAKIEHETMAPVDPEVTVSLLLPWSQGSNDLRGPIRAWLEEEGADAHMDDLLVRGFIQPQATGWDMALVGADTGGAIRMTVGPREPRQVIVSVTVPQSGGRASYALRTTDSEGAESVSSVIELQAEGDQVRIGQGLWS